MTIKTFTAPIGFSCAMHVLTDEKGNLLVDPGYCSGRVLSYLAEHGGVQAILLTHGHFDHIQSLDAIHAAYPDAPVYIHPADLPMLRNAALNGSSGMMGTVLTVEAPAKPLEEGTHTIAGHQVEVLHTPGHSQGSCVFSLPGEKVLFTGDTIIGNSIGRADLPGSSPEALYASLLKIQQLRLAEDTQAYFGHGDDMSYGDLLACNYFLHSR